MRKGEHTIKAEDIKTIVVIGAGIMGSGIAQNFAQAGLSIRLVDVDEEVLVKSLGTIDENCKLFKEHGLLREEPGLIKTRIETFTIDKLDSALEDCEFIVEVIPEILELKKELFRKLDSLPEEIILGSNTSSFTISSIADGMKSPERVVGIHYFNPAHIIPLVEVHRGKHTTDEAIELTRKLAIRSGKKPILIRKEIPGFVVNRIQSAMARESHYLIEEGVITPEDLDLAGISSWGFRLACLGSLETADLGGLDTIYRSCEHIFPFLNNDLKPSFLLADMVERGELGVKSGKGWHDYSGKSRAELLKERDRKLIRQLALFEQLMKEKMEKT